MVTFNWMIGWVSVDTVLEHEDGSYRSGQLYDANAPDPTTYYVDPPAGVPICTVLDDPRDVLITDAREATEHFDLDTHGFSFVKLPTDFHDFDDQDAVRNRLYPAMEQLTRHRLPGNSTW